MKQSRLTHRSRVTSLESRTTFVQCLFACLPCFCQAPGMSLALLLLWKVRGHQLQSSCNNTSCLGRMFSFHWYNPRVAIIYNAKTVSRRADVKPKGKYPAAGLLQKSFHSLETMNHSIFIRRYMFFSELIYLLIKSVGEEETRWKGGNMFVNFYFKQDRCEMIFTRQETEWNKSLHALYLSACCTCTHCRHDWMKESCCLWSRYSNLVCQKVLNSFVTSLG